MSQLSLQLWHIPINTQKNLYRFITDFWRLLLPVRCLKKTSSVWRFLLSKRQRSEILNIYTIYTEYCSFPQSHSFLHALPHLYFLSLVYLQSLIHQSSSCSLSTVLCTLKILFTGIGSSLFLTRRKVSFSASSFTRFWYRYQCVISSVSF